MKEQPGLFSLAAALLILSVLFGLLQRLAPALPQVPLFHRRRIPDFLYWFFTPIVTRMVTHVVLIAALVVVAVAFGFRGKVAELLAHAAQAGPFSKVPPRMSFPVALLAADFFGYWTHRLFHGRLLWKFHAIHHSATDLDWLAATRLHPVNDVLGKLLSVLPLLLLGFPTRVLAPVVPILTFWAIFLHANIRWGFGPLKYVVATPLFHRWHHTSEAEGLDKNFAGLFPLWDAVFGTLYLPKGGQPKHFGVAGEPIPAGFLAQLAYPFRAQPKTSQPRERSDAG